MALLAAGILLWSIAHLFKSVMPGARATLARAIGENPTKGIVALLIVASVVLMVVGWRGADYNAIYDPPIWGRHLHMAAMFIAVYLFGAAYAPSRIRAFIAHPMLVGMAIWAGGHLLANGDSRSLLLFGGLGLWAVVSIIAIMIRDRDKQERRELRGWGREIFGLLIAGGVYAVLFVTHQWYAGVPLFV